MASFPLGDFSRVSFERQVTLVIEGSCGGGGATHLGRPRNQRTGSVRVT